VVVLYFSSIWRSTVMRVVNPFILYSAWQKSPFFIKSNSFYKPYKACY
jgi:hypothetical protein